MRKVTVSGRSAVSSTNSCRRSCTVVVFAMAGETGSRAPALLTLWKSGRAAVGHSDNRAEDVCPAGERRAVHEADEVVGGRALVDDMDEPRGAELRDRVPGWMRLEVQGFDKFLKCSRVFFQREQDRKSVWVPQRNEDEADVIGQPCRWRASASQRTGVGCVGGIAEVVALGRVGVMGAEGFVW